MAGGAPPGYDSRCSRLNSRLANKNPHRERPALVKTGLHIKEDDRGHAGSQPEVAAIEAPVLAPVALHFWTRERVENLILSSSVRFAYIAQAPTSLICRWSLFWLVRVFGFRPFLNAAPGISSRRCCFFVCFVAASKTSACY